VATKTVTNGNNKNNSINRHFSEPRFAFLSLLISVSSRRRPKAAFTHSSQSQPRRPIGE